MRHLVRVNGFDHAFRREFGCPCERCLGRAATASTSVSLMSVDEDDSVVHHVLFDVGPGVVDSLVDCSRLSGERARLDQLVISHWHPDHTLGLNRLCETRHRSVSGRGEDPGPIPTWCRSGTAEWLRERHPYEVGRFLDVAESGEHSAPGTVLRAVSAADQPDALRVTPVSVSHSTADFNSSGEPTPCCAAFVIQLVGGGKAVLLWDVDNTNHWIERPASDEHREAVRLLSDADYLLVACNTWTVEEVDGSNLGHLSFETVRRYAHALNPSHTLLVHLSGHEDGRGNPGWGWDDGTWGENARIAWCRDGLPGSVQVPDIGRECEL